MSGEIRNYSHIALLCSDLERSRKFYRETLGLEETTTPEFAKPGVYYQLGQVQLHLTVTKAPIPDVPAISVMDGGPGFSHIALYLETDEFPKVVERLQEHEARMPIPVRYRDENDVTTVREYDPDLKGGSWSVFVKDPDGQTFEITDVPGY